MKGMNENSSLQYQYKLQRNTLKILIPRVIPNK